MEPTNDSTSASTENAGGGVDTPQYITRDDLTSALQEALSPLTSDLGSLKRTVTKSSKGTKEETSQNSTELSSLYERLDMQAMRSANITHEDDIKLAKETAKKWNMPIENLVYDEDFLAKLEKQKTNRANADASTNIKGDRGGEGGNAKVNPDYWIAKGVAPTPADIPDRQARTAVIRAMMKNASSSGKTFYND